MSHLYYFPFPIVFLSPCLMHKPHSITSYNSFPHKRKRDPLFCTLMCSIPFICLTSFLSDDLSHPAYTYSYIAWSQ